MKPKVKWGVMKKKALVEIGEDVEETEYQGVKSHAR